MNSPFEPYDTPVYKAPILPVGPRDYYILCCPLCGKSDRVPKVSCYSPPLYCGCNFPASMTQKVWI